MLLCHIHFSHLNIIKAKNKKVNMSASGQKHDYHLVDPSPWPLATSVATLITAVGSVYYFHTEVMWAMLLGFLLLIYCAFMWFRDVVIEAEHKGHHTPVVQIHHRYGMTSVSYTHLRAHET